jgi:stage II sporulation protein D
MKRILELSVAALLFAAYLPFAFAYLPSAPLEDADKPEATQQTSFRPVRDSAQSLTVMTDGGKVDMTMHDYLVGVVAAEMPADFRPEALKAQAVAARTYAVYGELAGKHKSDGADVCTDPDCCQAWRSEDQLKKGWGDKYKDRLASVTAAVEATDGQYLCSGGEPILAAFHSSSGGRTESSVDVWGRAEPYLVSVTSPETDGDVPNFRTTMTAAPIDFRDTILSAHPEADFTGAADTWAGAAEKDESGRVKTLTLGGVKISGEELRELFSLRSTEFELTYDGNFVFTVTGNGHGVGMSQYGAQIMAESGAGYEEILSHYYPGTELAGKQI